MTIIKVVKGDTNYDINFTLQDANSAAFDLTGATLLLKVQKEDVSTVKFSGSMAIVSAVAGTCKYTVQPTDFDEAGTFHAEIQATISSKIITWTNIRIEVLPELPK